jgi:hypothetical protein
MGAAEVISSKTTSISHNAFKIRAKGAVWSNDNPPTPAAWCPTRLAGCRRLGSQAPLGPFWSRACCGGCLASGTAGIAASAVGWSACQPWTQGGKLWQSWPTGPRPRGPPGAFVACGRRPPGIASCCWHGGARQPCTPGPHPRMAPCIAWGTAVTRPRVARSTLWPQKDGQAHRSPGFSGGAWAW